MRKKVNNYTVSADATEIEEYLEQLHNETPEGLRLTARTYVQKMVANHFKDRRWIRATRISAVNDWYDHNIADPKSLLQGELRNTDFMHTDWYKQKLSESAKKRWADPIKRANLIKAMTHK